LSSGVEALLAAYGCMPTVSLGSTAFAPTTLWTTPLMSTTSALVERFPLLIGQRKAAVIAGRMLRRREAMVAGDMIAVTLPASHKGGDQVKVFCVADMIEIRAFESDDWPAVWRIVEPVLRAGRTYGVPTDITESDAYAFWVENPVATFVATDADRRVVGTYFLKPNYAGPGDHVANCGYIVDAEAQGGGVASTMCRHSLQEAADRGFRAMQYNLVVATNEAAIAVWLREGFEIVGTLPGAFRHPDHGYVDAHIMFRTLAP
jgi:RimJ/RimL family protein N-acetyltransferase